MRIKQLDHFNIIGNRADLERVTAFYTEILGFEEGPRPDFGIELEGAWLYREGKPLVHLAVVEMEDSMKPGLYETQTGYVHHIAFDCEGFQDSKLTLEKHGIEYYITTVPGTKIEQLFFHDPTGIRLELNFKNG
jgi:catechol 2,3-dioxygenase-like lactoylglutathione lyase family enzyme